MGISILAWLSSRDQYGSRDDNQANTLYPSVMLGLFLYTDDSFVEVAINWFFRWKGPFKLMTRSSVMLSGVVLSYCLWWSTALLFVQTVYLHWCIFFVWSSLLFFFSYVKGKSGQTVTMKVVKGYMIVCRCTFIFDRSKESIITRISISFNCYKCRDRCHYLDTLILKW
jgi:hypothetical protein